MAVCTKLICSDSGLDILPVIDYGDVLCMNASAHVG